jgi:signal transduction histidine kinase
LKEGLILPTTEVYKFYTADTQDIQIAKETYLSANYKFLHDRIQQAAYSLIPEKEKKETHLKIGQLLLNNIPESQQEERIFEIVNQLNYGIELISEQQERDELAYLNLIAGKKAKSSTAYQSAINYFNKGIQLLAEHRWQEQYKITLELYEAMAESSYLNGNFEQMKTWNYKILENVKSSVDTAKTYQLIIQYYASQNKQIKAVETAIFSLKYLNIKLSLNPQYNEVISALEEVKINLKNKEAHELINLPQMTDLHAKAAMPILLSVIASAFQAAPSMLPIIVSRLVTLSLKYGNASESAFAYSMYGLILCGVLEEIDLGYQFGQLASCLLSENYYKKYYARTLFVITNHIKPWKEHFKESLPLFLNSYLFGLDTGDLEFSALSIQIYCYFAFFSSQELSELENNMDTYGKAISHMNQEHIFIYNEIWHQCVLNLINCQANNYYLVCKNYNENEMVTFHIEAQDRTALNQLYLSKLILCYLFGDICQASQNSVHAEKYLDGSTATILVPAFYFYDSLVKLEMHSHTVNSEQKLLMDKVILNQQKMKKWAVYAPMNYQHKVNLVEAEKCRVLNQKLEAMELYDKAIAGAKENEYLQEEALANELAAKFYLELGREKVAQTYMIDAYYCYSHWGAKAKVKDLEQRYPQLLAPILEQQKISLNSFRTLTSFLKTDSRTQATISSNATEILDALDFTSVVKASQALSNEIELNQLISQLMKIMMENVGATKGVLILSQAEQLTIKAISNHHFNNDKTIDFTQQSIRVEESLEVPLSIINSVKRSLTTLKIDNLSPETQFVSDSYLMQQQPQSLLCLPICNRGHFVGILYLENNLTTGAFTDERVEVLKLLCSQAAISLENAQLYQKSQDYAQQLEQSLKDLQEAQVQLVQSEKMSALGQMMAGITHEINNPVGFISGNVNQAEEALQDLLNYLQLYQKYHPACEAVTNYGSEIELEYLLEDLPAMIASMKTGVNRIREISQSMRIFSRSDTDNKVELNLHEGIDSTLLILKHRLKANEKRAEVNVIKNYGNLPKILGFPGQLNQVFMNIIANAIDVFDEGKNIENPQIVISTALTEDQKQVIVKIKDNGLGMSEGVQEKVFDHLFTTKPVGKGTGLGLSISRQVVEDKHGGTIKCQSNLGRGTEFIICLPIV